MNKSNKNLAFTLVELLISISITVIVIFWFTSLYINISDNILSAEKKVIILNDIKDFTTKVSYSTTIYNTWIIISESNKFDTLILTNSWNTNWYLIWVFDCNNKSWIDFKLSSNSLAYDNNCFWYFPLKTSQINNIISNTWTIYTSSFNAWTLYKNLVVKNFTVQEFSPNHIFNLNLDFFDNFYPDLVWENIENLNYDYSKIIHINLNF